MQIDRFIGELKRRKVFRVVGVYAVGAWAAIQVADTVFPLLGAPEWAVRLVVWISLLGFPVAVVLAWIFDVTSHGVVRTPDSAALPAAGEAAPVAVAAPPRSRAAGFFGLGMLVALVTVAAYFQFAPSPTEDIDSIAVLPFADMSAAKDQEFFSDGMTEELLDRLAQVENLRVAARTSSFAYKNTSKDVREIGRELRVASVLEGSVRREGNRLRVTAQLIDVATGYHLWSQTFDREVESVFDIQDEISNAIVTELRKEFSAVGAGPTRAPATVRARDTYYQAMLRLNNRTAANVQQSITLFEQVIAEDPEFAPAFAGIAQAYAVLPTLTDFPVEEAIGKGTSAAAQALALDAKLPEAHAALGQIAQNFEWDFTSAERAYRRAIQFNKDYATAHQWYAETLMILGRNDEARQEIETAVMLDPLSPPALTVRAYLLGVSGDANGALAGFRNVFDVYPDFRIAQVNYLLFAAMAGQGTEALPVAERAAAGDTALASALRTLLTTPRGSPEAAVTAALAVTDAKLPPATAALWHGVAGRPQSALAILERAAAAQSDPNLPLVLVHPALREVRELEGFEAVASAVRLR